MKAMEIDNEELGMMCYDALRKILGQTGHYEVSDSVKANWADMAEVLFEVARDKIETTWQKLARACWAASQKKPLEEYDDLPPVLKAIWEAVARHGINVITSEDLTERDVAVRYDWSDFILKRRQEFLNG